MTQPIECRLKERNSFHLLQVALELARSDHLLQPVVGVDHFTGKIERQEGEGENDNKSDQKGHDQRRKPFLLFQKVLKPTEQGMEGDRQDAPPEDRDQERREDLIKEVKGKE